jgi:hypothetical protein
MIYRLVQQIVTYLGPGAEWVIFIAGPLALVLVVLLIVEVPRVFALRRGHRGARTVLLVFAILTALGTGWILVNALQGLEDPYDESFSQLYALATGALFFVALAALVGAILPFLPVASHYFPGTVTAAASVPTPAQWSPDPSGRHQHRYWDGVRWTEHVANDGVVSQDLL